MPLFANLIRLDYCDWRLDTFDTVVQVSWYFANWNHGKNFNIVTNYKVCGGCRTLDNSIKRRQTNWKANRLWRYGRAIFASTWGCRKKVEFESRIAGWSFVKYLHRDFVVFFEKESSKNVHWRFERACNYSPEIVFASCATFIIHLFHQEIDSDEGWLWIYYAANWAK